MIWIRFRPHVDHNFLFYCLDHSMSMIERFNDDHRIIASSSAKFSVHLSVIGSVMMVIGDSPINVLPFFEHKLTIRSNRFLLVEYRNKERI
jgi:hypothetical protein